MENGAAQPDALTRAREFLSQRDELRAQLEKELADAKARVAEIETLLRDLGSNIPSQFDAAELGRAIKQIKAVIDEEEAEPLDPKSATIPQVIAAVVRATPGMPVAGVVKEVRALKSDAATTVVYPAIYRMAKDGRLVVKGKAYFLGGAATE
jgi:hypothetical protein